MIKVYRLEPRAHRRFVADFEDTKALADFLHKESDRCARPFFRMRTQDNETFFDCGWDTYVSTTAIDPKQILHN